MDPSEGKEEAPAIVPADRDVVRILLVEDDGRVREILSRGLSEQGFDVASAKSAEEALELFHAERPFRKAAQTGVELLITDVILPGLDGHELAQVLQRELPDMKVLYISGYPRELLTSRGLDPEAYVVQKPVGFEVLAAEARRILGSSGSRRTGPGERKG